MAEKCFKYRIYPNKNQKQQLTKTFGCVRFVYNYYLNKRIAIYEEDKSTFGYTKCSEDMTSLKQQDMYEWLQEVDSVALQSSIRNLDTAFQNFFEKRTGFPKFKSKKTHQFSYTTKYTNGNIQLFEKCIKLPKLGLVNTKVSRPVQGRILSATVSQTPTGKYYVSVCCTEAEAVPLPKTSKSVGIDLGIKNFAVFSDEFNNIPNPRYLNKDLKILTRHQKSLSRKTIGSNNWHKARLLVSKQHEKITNKRSDFLHKLSKQIVTEYDTICVENLDVSAMLKSKQLSRSIADVSWSEFVRQLAYKADWYGKQIVKVNRFYPSSQTCNCCGYVNPAMKNLSIRNWYCPGCGASHDRDKNAAINILNEGLKIA